MEDIFSGVWDFFAGVVEWTPDVIDVAEEFIPSGEPNARKRKPEDGGESAEG
jgi:hypothetical protein